MSSGKISEIMKSPGETVLLSGNDAIARGAMEAGVSVVTGYPGTPATGIIEVLAKNAEETGLYAEFSVNEMVAFEVAAASAMAGVRSLTAMKMLGVNWIADPLTVISVTGVKGGLVIVTADDPAQFSSQNAEDTRFYAMLSKIPCLEPLNGQEAKDIIPEAFDLSEKLELPVFVRITPRICHSIYNVELGEKMPVKRDGKFEKDLKRYVMISTYSRDRQGIVNEKLDRATRLNAKSKFNKRVKFGDYDSQKIKRGIIATGINYSYVEEAIDQIGFDGEVLKLATTYPIPDPLMASFMKDKDEVLIVEEGEPVTEVIVRSVAQYLHMDITIKGKSNGLFERAGELNPDLVAKAVSEFTGRKYVEAGDEESVPSRTPGLCAGCPHRATYYAIHKALRDEGNQGIVAGDRGCYNQGAHAPLEAIDTCICMGASIAMASGFSHANVKEPSLAVIGDGTFFHGGIPSLLNAVHNWSDITVLILDNSITGMTGHQPNPGTGNDAMGRPQKKIDIFEVVKSMGVERIFEINAFDTENVISRVKEEIKANGPSVIISRAPCAIVVEREKKGKFEKATVDEDACTGCKLCINTLGCPAFEFHDGKLVINDLCTGCGLCSKICPVDAIDSPVVLNGKKYRTYLDGKEVVK